jgi:S4 domain protein YaaA
MEKESTQSEIVIHTPYIQLGQLMKIVGLIETGGQIKSFLSQNPIQVNQRPEQRRGRKLYPGDQIMVQKRLIIIKGL